MALNTGIYLVENNRTEVHELFVKNVVSGRKGLWMTKSNPMELRSRHGFVSTVIIGLNEYLVTSDGKKRLESSFIDFVDQFLERYENMVILLEDVEELVNESSADLIELIKLVSAHFLSKNIIFILSLDGKYDEIKTKMLKADYGFIKI